MPIRPTRRSAIAMDKRKLFDGVNRCESLKKANKTTRLPPTVNNIIKIIPKQTDTSSIVLHGDDIVSSISIYMDICASFVLTQFTSKISR